MFPYRKMDLESIRELNPHRRRISRVVPIQQIIQQFRLFCAPTPARGDCGPAAVLMSLGNLQPTVEEIAQLRYLASLQAQKFGCAESAQIKQMGHWIAIDDLRWFSLAVGRPIVVFTEMFRNPYVVGFDGPEVSQLYNSAEVSTLADVLLANIIEMDLPVDLQTAKAIFCDSVVVSLLNNHFECLILN